MNFLVDNHLPSALAIWLQSKGHTATHVREVQLNRAQDITIWNYATQHGCIILTKDEDFIDLALLHAETVPVIWLHIGNCRKQVLIDAINAVWPQVEQRLTSGEQIIEVY